MKNLSLILNVILFILVGILFYLHFAAPDKDKAQQVVVPESGSGNGSDLSISYVNLDSLEAHYSYFQSKLVEMGKKQQRIQNELAAKEREIQNDIQDLQKRANSKDLSPAEIEKVQQRIIEKRQKLQERDQALSQQFMKEQQDFNEDLHNRIQTFLNSYNADKKYDFIFSYSNEGSPVLIGNKAYDITSEILNGLNAEAQAGSK